MRSRSFMGRLPSRGSLNLVTFPQGKVAGSAFFGCFFLKTARRGHFGTQEVMVAFLESRRIGQARRNLSLEKKFWARVAQPDEGCWDWQGARHKSGHGSFGHGGAMMDAHRTALELTLGRPLGEGMWALHTCGRAPCCRPDHLYEGTRSDNLRDQYAFGERISHERFIRERASAQEGMALTPR